MKEAPDTLFPKLTIDERVQSRYLWLRLASNESDEKVWEDACRRIAAEDCRLQIARARAKTDKDNTP